ncbi:MAG: sporulation protein YqfD [Ruminococcus sp.]|nr:sporulation protein YqfD [Ruminococcus sp.]
MFLKRLLGVVSLEIISAEPLKLLNELIRQNITLLSSYIDGYTLNAKIYFVDYFKVKKVVRVRDEKIEAIKDNGGIISFFFRYRLRYGLMAGFIISLLTCIFLSNVLLEVQINGADEQTKAQVLSVLEQDGVDIGAFLPTVNRLALECDLVDNTSTVALADTRTEGCTLIIDIKMIDEKPSTKTSRIYADIVADRDAVITSMEIFAGDKVKVVGEEVKKGEVIVSGKMTLRGKLLPIEKEAYFYSSGKVYGDYDETVSFYVPFNDVEQTVEREVSTAQYFQFFSAQIPFNPFADNSGLKESESVSYFSLFGLELPFGIATKTYDKYDFKAIVRSEEEAISVGKRRTQNYEENILKDKTILSRSEKVDVADEGITITVTYRLNGEIGEIKEIFKK